MQDKTKVTLYLPPELHRQLKIRAAVEAEPMSAIAERAIVFYLTHPGVVDEVEMSHGRTHQVYSCPGCESPLVLREGEMVALQEQSAVLVDEEISVAKVGVPVTPEQQGEQELVLAK
ncbi:MAG: hypothetical protein SFY66_02860 [Oculatellaceae cyanobacterium bins.114]|nr:hypothetical protein [Oculatellaceae cyanobacterium bins.114]